MPGRCQTYSLHDWAVTFEINIGHEMSFRPRIKANIRFERICSILRLVYNLLFYIVYCKSERWLADCNRRTPNTLKGERTSDTTAETKQKQMRTITSLHRERYHSRVIHHTPHEYKGSVRVPSQPFPPSPVFNPRHQYGQVGSPLLISSFPLSISRHY
jgi:hypothetical protein